MADKVKTPEAEKVVLETIESEMDEYGCIIKPIGEIITTKITNEDESPLNEG